MSGQGHIGSPFVRSLRGLSFFAGVAAAFIFMPKLYERTAPSVWRYTLEHYQGMDTQLVLLGLKVVLALAVYFTVSAVINAALSAYGLHLAVRRLKPCGQAGRLNFAPPATPQNATSGM